ncbi:hypothetical protein [Olleya sp. Bg11-27]|uniref:hypothetical protein n=1 Tax=Olleya sp. Bg11-27 TaxID=2058135 RepID=UPI000C30B54B|nr:hypothetical protein [Olleya sp. Bg11-27]AUC74570.1 hypothetical protein CW732_02290 [Olleya sp. Bg11-27]
MKKTLIILALTLCGTNFAKNSVELENELPLDSKFSIETTFNSNDDSCTRSCYATATNTETGETYSISGLSTSGDCFTAAGNCIAKLRIRVQAFIAAN